MATAISTIVGAFVLGALALGVAAIILFGGESMFTTKLRVVAYFQNSVAGLTVGAPVTLRGVKIGTVQSMKVYLKLPELVPVIPVYMEIEPGQVSWTTSSLPANASDIEMAIKAGLRAQLATQSLVTGQVAVNLDFYPGSAPSLMGGSSASVPEIPTIPSDLQHIKDQIADLKLPELADKARVALTGIDQLVAQLNGKLGPMVDSVRQTSDSTRATMEATTAAVQQLQLDASRTLDSVGHLANTTENQVQTDGKQIGQFATTADHAASRAQKVMENLDDMTAPRSPMRGDLEAALRDLAASASSLRNFTHDLNRNPGATLLGRESR
jgi:paraquat-inducible protein B